MFCQTSPVLRSLVPSKQVLIISKEKLERLFVHVSGALYCTVNLDPRAFSEMEGGPGTGCYLLPFHWSITSPS